MSDCLFLLLIQVALVLLVIYAIFRQWVARRREARGMNGVDATVIRGEIGWSHLNLAHGIASILLIQVISVSESFKGHKVALSIADLGILIYLFFYNGWFRNKVMGYIIKSKQFEE